MKKLSTKMRILILVATCSLLLLPIISQADEYWELGTVEFGPGTNTKTFSLVRGAMTMTATPDLKSIIISAQNGTNKGKDRVSSAVVSLNEQEVFSQKHFNQNVVSGLSRTITIGAPDLEEVVLTAKVNGRKNARLFVTVTAVFEETVRTMMWFLDTDVPPNGMGGPISGMGTEDVAPPPDPRGVWVPIGGDIR